MRHVAGYCLGALSHHSNRSLAGDAGRCSLRPTFLLGDSRAISVACVVRNRGPVHRFAHIQARAAAPPSHKSDIPRGGGKRRGELVAGEILPQRETGPPVEYRDLTFSSNSLTSSSTYGHVPYRDATHHTPKSLSEKSGGEPRLLVESTLKVTFAFQEAIACHDKCWNLIRCIDRVAGYFMGVCLTMAIPTTVITISFLDTIREELVSFYTIIVWVICFFGSIGFLTYVTGSIHTAVSTNTLSSNVRGC